MTDKTDPSMDDIDAFLRHDASQDSRKPDDENLVRLGVSSMPRTTDPVARINNRVTHVMRSLNQALTQADEMSKTLGTDEDLCDEFCKDIDEWDSVIGDLESALPDLPDAETPPVDEDVASAVAWAIDTYIEAARENDDDVARENDDDVRAPDESRLQQPDENLLEQQVADAFEQSVGESGNGVEIADEDPTMNREQEELLRSLEMRESRIRDLESQLETFQSSQAEDTQGEPDSGGIERDESGLCVNRLLIGLCGNENLKYPLTRHIMTIGREPHNDIHIRSRYVSRFHVRIVSDADGSIIEDLNSRNGVRVNSHKVQRQQLNSGDLIDLGRVQLKYIDLMEDSAGEGQA